MARVFDTLLSTSWFVVIAVAVIIFGITQLLKLPIKHFTNKIEDETTRKIVNLVILLIPFGIGLLFEFLYGTFYLHTGFDIIAGLGYGASGISLYGIIERFFGIKVKNPYTDTEEGQAVIDLVQDVAQDGKVDKADMTAVQEFFEKVK